MTAKSNMTAKPNRALERLADVLVEDIAGTPADQLLAEVAEDYGNPRALAATFDKIVLRARTGNDRSVSGALPTRSSRAFGGLASGKGLDIADRLRAFWQDVVPPIFDVIFPNRLAMLTISSACIASLAVIVAAPTVIDRIQEWHSGAPTGPASGPSVRERDAESERSVTRGLYPSAPPPAASGAGRRPEASAVGTVGPKPDDSIQTQPDAGAAPLQPPRSVPLTAGREPSASTPVAPVAAAPNVASLSNPAADSYDVQISLQRSKADAQASVRQLRAKFAKELSDQEATIRRADLGPKGVYYRALVGPFGSADDADRFCAKLKAAGGQCTVQKD